MFKILRKKKVAEGIWEMEVHAPLVAKHAKPGQFFVIRIHEKGERIPLTLADWDPEKGTITSVFQVVGKSTLMLSKLGEGDSILDLLGPLGRPLVIEKPEKVIIAGGGAGVPAIFPKAKYLKAEGSYVISVLGFRNKSLVFWEEKMREVSNELLIYTDDGSYGKKGLVTHGIAEAFRRHPDAGCVICAGPVPMMEAVANLCKELGLPAYASLNPIMIDGTGMCGCCRVTVGGETRFVCVDGPVFDALKVNWKELKMRNRRFVEEERLALERGERDA